MKLLPRKSQLVLAAMTMVAGIFYGSAGLANAAAVKVELSGAHEVPPVTTKATGDGTITVADDKTVSGSVMTSNIVGTMAHIHEADAMKNGPVIIPLIKKGEHEWVVPAGAKLTDAQYKSYQAGDLYVNVHTAEHKAGEIRAQIKP